MEAGWGYYLIWHRSIRTSLHIGILRKLITDPDVEHSTRCVVRIPRIGWTPHCNARMHIKLWLSGSVALSHPFHRLLHIFCCNFISGFQVKPPTNHQAVALIPKTADLLYQTNFFPIPTSWVKLPAAPLTFNTPTYSRRLASLSRFLYSQALLRLSSHPNPRSKVVLLRSTCVLHPLYLSSTKVVLVPGTGVTGTHIRGTW